MIWEKVKLGDICTKIGSGATPKGGSAVYIEKGTTFIRSQNVYNLYFNYGGLVHINEDDAKKLDGVTIQENDVLLNITGDSVARTCIVPSELIPARVNQHVSIVRPDMDILNPIFLNYYLASPYMQSHMLGLAVGKGVSRNAMTKDMIAAFEVPCPSMDIQEKIIYILKPYDDLIKNNKQQIKLLEEVAQRLYKEWFVDFHFPGYENVKIVDGVPEGWKSIPINMVAKLKAGGDKPKTFSEKMTNENKIPVFSNGITRKGLMGYTDKAVIKNPSVTISARGTVGIVFLRTEPYVPIVRLISVTPIEEKIDILYLYLYLINQNFRSTGAAQQQITVPLLKNKKIICPTDDVRKSFNDVLTPIFNKIEILEKYINKLLESRDRLLQKLMSGEIEV